MEIPGQLVQDSRARHKQVEHANEFPKLNNSCQASVTDLSIVIVSWNTKKYLEECLTLLRTIDGNLSVEIIVVDNAPPMARRMWSALNSPK
jgi:hypothetical protein